MNRLLWLLFSVLIAGLALGLASTSSTLRANGLNPGPGVQAVIVRVDHLSSDQSFALASTVGNQARLIGQIRSPASAPARGGGSSEMPVKPSELWQSWKIQNLFWATAQTCTFSLDLRQLQDNRELFKPGNLLWLRVDPGDPGSLNGCDNNPGTVPDGKTPSVKITPEKAGPVSVFSGNMPRLLVLIATFGWLLALVYALVPSGPYAGVTRLIVGKDNRYSNAQFQMFAWFFVFIAGYVSTMVWRIVSGNLQLAGGITSPANLLALTGLAAGTFGVATVITSQATQQGTLVKLPADQPRLENLYSDDAGRFDFGDFQSLIVTLVAVVGYLIMLAGWQENVLLSRETTLPDVGATILTIFGAGQATYLLKKGLRADAIKDFGLELQPEVIELAAPPAAVANPVMTLNVWHAAGVQPSPPTVTRQMTGSGGAAVAVGPALAGGHAMLTQYPITVDTTGLTRGEYTFALAVSTPARTQEIQGKVKIQ